MTKKWLANFARGGLHYSRVRHRVVLRAIRERSLDVTDLGKHLERTFFTLPQRDWVALDIGKEDWSVLAKLHNADDSVLFHFLCSLVSRYVAANGDSVTKLYRASHSLSEQLISGRPLEGAATLAALNASELTSLFSSKLAAATYFQSTEDLSRFLRRSMPSAWARNRLLYPFLNYCNNNVSDWHLDNFLSYVINESYEDVERDTVKTLLCDEAGGGLSVLATLYLATILHPFDACEILLNMAENAAAQGAVPTALADAVRLVGEVIPSTRPKLVCQIINRESLPWISTPSADALFPEFSLDIDTKELFSDFLRLDRVCVSAHPRLPEIFRMRTQEYPQPVDFELTTTTYGKWRFIDGGRILNCLIYGLYLLPRRSESFERRNCSRIAYYSGAIYPFVMYSPSGKDWAASMPQLAVPANVGPLPLDQFCDRTWIMRAHSHLDAPAKNLQIASWLSLVRELLPVRPNYLSGIRWDFLESFVALRRLLPLRGDPDACYALLLRQIEERTVDSWLRTAIEPLCKGHTLESFVAYLIQTYHSTATAFVRYLLTPDNILLLGLAPNYTAALSGRVSALAECVRQFGFSEMMTEQAYQQESKALTATIFLTNVSGSQFDIAWDLLRRDVLDQEADNFETYNSLRRISDNQPILSRARIMAPHHYKNGQIVEYEMENRQWPLAVTITSIVDAFLRHPSVGLEVLLSTRFRHDTMRLAYEMALERVKGSVIPGVFRDDRVIIVERLEEELYSILGRWLNEYMQTRRPLRPNGLFELTPDNSEMARLTEKLEHATTFGAAFETVSVWLQERLEEQIAAARVSFETKLVPQLQAYVEAAPTKIAAELGVSEPNAKRVCNAVGTIVKRRSSELLAWFSPPTKPAQDVMSVRDIKFAIEGIFEAKISNGRLHIYSDASTDLIAALPSESARLLFDLMGEVIRNADKHGPFANRVRISARNGEAGCALLFSSKAPPGTAHEWKVPGVRYESVSDRIFGEGKSGLEKIAALAATLRQKPTEITVSRRKRSFHLIVPMEAGGR